MDDAYMKAVLTVIAAALVVIAINIHNGFRIRGGEIKIWTSERGIKIKGNVGVAHPPEEDEKRYRHGLGFRRFPWEPVQVQIKD